MNREYNFAERKGKSGRVFHFPEGSDAEPFLEEYNGRAEKYYKGNKNLKVLSLQDIKGVPTIVGSNTFAPILAYQILKSQGYKPATLSNIERTLEDGDILGIRDNYYVDLGIVLRSRDDSNASLANKLADQLEDRGISLKNPIYIPSSSLELISDQSSKDYGLVLKLKEDAEIIVAHELLGSNSGNKFLRANEKGLPIFDSMEDRTLHAQDNGLSRLGLVRCLLLDSGNDNLAYSNEYGGVVLVKG